MELTGSHPPVVLVGSDALAVRLVEELGKLEDVATGRKPTTMPANGSRLRRLPSARPAARPASSSETGWVTVVVPDLEGPFVPHLRRSGATVRTGSGRDKAVLEAAGVPSASALVLLADDDVGNLHAALAARELNPEIRLVIRMFDEKLARRVEGLFGHDCTVLSSSLIAAPSFVDAALGDGQQLIEIGGRTLNAGPPETVAGSPYVVLARTDPAAPEGTALLPDRDCTDAELVLGEPALRVADVTRRRMRWPGGFTRWASGRLRWTLAGLSALVAVGSFVLKDGLGLSWLNSFYGMVSTLTTGAPDGVERAGAAVTLFVAGSMLAGVVLIALITAFAVDDLLGSRLAGTFGPSVGRVTGHVVVCGLGTVGLRMVEQLRAAGVPVVGIDTDPDASVAAVSRRLGVPVVRGDASDEHTLRAARAHRARSVVAATDDDVANVEVGLAVWAMDQDLRIVLRLFDQDLSDRITGALPQAVSLSVSAAAAPVFLAAMLGREVKAAIGHGRGVLLVAEVPVGPGSPADQQPLSDLEQSGRVRVFGHVREVAAPRNGGRAGAGRTRTLTWHPRPDATVAAGDTVLLVATRAGLTDVLLRTGATSDVPDAGGVPEDAGPPYGAPAGRRFRPVSARLAGRWRSGPVAVTTPWSPWSSLRAILDRRADQNVPRGDPAADGREAPDENLRGSR
ncbi:NAD-binding protein [Cryptosporangium aurantiacum]|uniref:Trk K+ transport system, NAD-binding component n=1 Tax=Cryptosporangium aurantiacum TaxID=134849 RepID=A0A1M7HU59_9ACTN|nr:NAD(P)-binding protein [Cryptosporangium aurantiacum]SHM32024.1 Trk K+ transport system, NAD-binding component [Cryptosporangium aurantiacum]